MLHATRPPAAAATPLASGTRRPNRRTGIYADAAPLRPEAASVANFVKRPPLPSASAAAPPRGAGHAPPPPVVKASTGPDDAARVPSPPLLDMNPARDGLRQFAQALRERDGAEVVDATLAFWDVYPLQPPPDMPLDAPHTDSSMEALRVGIRALANYVMLLQRADGSGSDNDLIRLRMTDILKLFSVTDYHIHGSYLRYLRNPALPLPDDFDWAFCLREASANVDERVRRGLGKLIASRQGLKSKDPAAWDQAFYEYVYSVQHIRGYGRQRTGQGLHLADDGTVLRMRVDRDRMRAAKTPPSDITVWKKRYPVTTFDRVSASESLEVRPGDGVFALHQPVPQWAQNFLQGLDIEYWLVKNNKGLERVCKRRLKGLFFLVQPYLIEHWCAVASVADLKLFTARLHSIARTDARLPWRACLQKVAQDASLQDAYRLFLIECIHTFACAATEQQINALLALGGRDAQLAVLKHLLHPSAPPPAAGVDESIAEAFWQATLRVLTAHSASTSRAQAACAAIFAACVQAMPVTAFFALLPVTDLLAAWQRCDEALSTDAEPAALFVLFLLTPLLRHYAYQTPSDSATRMCRALEARARNDPARTTRLFLKILRDDPDNAFALRCLDDAMDCLSSADKKRFIGGRLALGAPQAALLDALVALPWTDAEYALLEGTPWVSRYEAVIVARCKAFPASSDVQLQHDALLHLVLALTAPNQCVSTATLQACVEWLAAHGAFDPALSILCGATSRLSRGLADRLYGVVWVQQGLRMVRCAPVHLPALNSLLDTAFCHGQHNVDLMGLRLAVDFLFRGPRSWAATLTADCASMQLAVRDVLRDAALRLVIYDPQHPEAGNWLRASQTRVSVADAWSGYQDVARQHPTFVLSNVYRDFVESNGLVRAAVSCLREGVRQSAALEYLVTAMFLLTRFDDARRGETTRQFFDWSKAPTWQLDLTGIHAEQALHEACELPLALLGKLPEAHAAAHNIAALWQPMFAFVTQSLGDSDPAQLRLLATWSRQMFGLEFSRWVALAGPQSQSVDVLMQVRAALASGVHACPGEARVARFAYAEECLAFCYQSLRPGALFAACEALRVMHGCASSPAQSARVVTWARRLVDFDEAADGARASAFMQLCGTATDHGTAWMQLRCVQCVTEIFTEAQQTLPAVVGWFAVWLASRHCDAYFQGCSEAQAWRAVLRGTVRAGEETEAILDVLRAHALSPMMQTFLLEEAVLRSNLMVRIPAWSKQQAQAVLVHALRSTELRAQRRAKRAQAMILGSATGITVIEQLNRIIGS